MNEIRVWAPEARGVALEHRSGAAAMADTAHMEKAFAHNEEWRAWLSEEIAKTGLTVTPSVANFLLIHFPPEAGRTVAEADEFLKSRRIILRRVENYGLPNALRLTIGAAEENRAVARALSDFMAGGNGGGAA
jgi:histidinol-phosphate aminotransferase